jgi:hypothetical protein
MAARLSATGVAYQADNFLQLRAHQGVQNAQIYIKYRGRTREGM